MSIQAVAWALEQDFTGETPKGRMVSAHAAKLVLIALANHADHISGHCWPSTETIAREASCTVRSVYRLISALARNGFIEVRKVRGADGRQRANNYWLLFDRAPAPWQYFNRESEDDDPLDIDPGDSVSKTENEADIAEKPSESPGEMSSESLGQHDIRVPPHIMLEPSVLEPSIQDSWKRKPPEEATASQPDPPALVSTAASKAAFDATKPLSYDPQQRSEQKKKLQAAEEARKAEPKFVSVGTEPWKAWVAYKSAELGKPWNLRTTANVKGVVRTGWWFPQLWPPKSTGPPGYLSPDDADEFGKEITR